MALNPMDGKVVFAGLSFLLAAIGALGVAYAVFKSATVTKTIELLETENKALGQSVSRQSGDILTLQERVTSLEGENKVLKNVVTGETAVKELNERMVLEHAQLAAVLDSIVAILKEILNQLQRFRTPGDLIGER